MKIQDIKKMFFSKICQIFLVLVAIAILPLCGCNIFGFLASPGPFEKKIPPKYNLQSQQDRKILLIIECPRSSGVDFDIKKKLKEAMKIYITEHMKIDPENLFMDQSGGETALSHDPLKAAKEMGTGYVLLLQVDNYSLKRINTQNYYIGEMRSRAILMDADLGKSVWPNDPRGEIVHVGVDVETQGREMAVTRLISATAHCALRELYPCEKLKFKNSDEVMTLQDAMETETF